MSNQINSLDQKWSGHRFSEVEDFLKRCLVDIPIEKGDGENSVVQKGQDNAADGANSCAEGIGTQTTNMGEHARGVYNKSNLRPTEGSDEEKDAKTTRSSVGIGSNNVTRRNAWELMANGDLYVIGIGRYDGTNAGQPGVLPVQKALALNEELAALAALVDNAGDHKAVSYDAEEAYKVCGFRTVISGAGVPSLETIPLQFGIPAFIGQLYIDTSAASGGLYYAVGTSSISDWKNA
jgi:hypothetical protein